MILCRPAATSHDNLKIPTIPNSSDYPKGLQLVRCSRDTYSSSEMASFSESPNVFELIIDLIDDWLEFGIPRKGKGADGSPY